MSNAAAPAQPGMQDSPIVSVVVVNYSTRDLTLECLRSVYAEARLHAFELIVVDNASTDGSVKAIREEFPDIRLTASTENLGFAAGNNLAAAEAQGEWLLLLNPDTIVLDGAIDTLLDFASEHGEAAIFGGRTLFPDGSLNPTSCWARATLWSSLTSALGLTAAFPGSRMFDPEAMGDWDRDTARKVDIVTGCFFLLRKRDWERLGGFDERFYMYGEETDLCLRAAKLGLSCMICPDAQIVHYGGASEKARAGKMVRLFRAKSQLCSKHWSASAAWLGTRMLDLWALLRVVAFAGGKLFGFADGENLQTWLEVWRNRRSWHLTRGEMSGRAPAAIKDRK
jgi:GT2 family glycosyltransferase